jgi:hypothetical protein
VAIRPAAPAYSSGDRFRRPDGRLCCEGEPNNSPGVYSAASGISSESSIRVETLGFSNILNTTRRRALGVSIYLRYPSRSAISNPFSERARQTASHRFAAVVSVMCELTYFDFLFRPRALDFFAARARAKTFFITLRSDALIRMNHIV